MAGKVAPTTVLAGCVTKVSLVFVVAAETTNELETAPESPVAAAASE